METAVAGIREMILMRTDGGAVADILPMDTSQALFHFNDQTLTYAGRYLHDEEQVPHSHSFVEIAFVLSGEGVHRSMASGSRSRPVTSR